jgi:hypothetical protein
LECGITVNNVEAEVWRTDVIVLQFMVKNLVIASKIFVRGELNPFFLLDVNSQTIFCAVMSSKEHGFKTHIIKESCIGV